MLYREFFCLAIDKNKKRDYKITIKFIIYFIFLFMTDTKNFVKAVNKFNSQLTAKIFAGCDYDFIHRVIVYYFIHNNAGIMFPDKNISALFDTKDADCGFRTFEVDKEDFLKMISYDEDYIRFKSLVLPKNGDKLLEKWCLLIRSTVDRNVRSTMSTKLRRNALPEKAIEMLVAKGLYKSAEEARNSYIESLKLTKFIMGTFIFMNASSYIFGFFKESAENKNA